MSNQTAPALPSAGSNVDGSLPWQRASLLRSLRTHARAYEDRNRLQKLLHHPYRFVRSEAAFRLQRVVATDATTFWGERMTLTLPEPVSLFLYRYGYFEEGLTAFFLATLRRGDCLVDVGSHYGYFSLLARHLVGETGRIVAFEPTPSTFAVNRANTGRFANISVENLAAWSKRTTVTLQDLGVAWSSHNTLLKPKMVPARFNPATVNRIVQCVKLDDYFAEKSVRPNLVKIDAESAELEILKGLTQTLTTVRPMLTLEVGDDETGGTEIRSSAAVEFCGRFGYSPFAYRDGAIVAHRIQDAYAYDNIFMIPQERAADAFLIPQPS